MKVSIKTIKITSVISALSLVIALLMGAEYFKDASQIYLFGISWVTLQNTAFGIFGSAALAAVSAGIIYGVDKEAYLNKSEQYLIHVCTKSKTAFVQLTEANKILENGILSKNEKATFTGVSTIVATVYKGNIIKNLIMDCQSYTKYRPNETTGGIFVSWRRKEELPTGA